MSTLGFSAAMTRVIAFIHALLVLYASGHPPCRAVPASQPFWNSAASDSTSLIDRQARKRSGSGEPKERRWHATEETLTIRASRLRRGRNLWLIYGDQRNLANGLLQAARHKTNL